MPTWTLQDLASLDRAHELQVAGRRKDGSRRPLVTVWHVVVDGDLYVRSVRGDKGKWYQGAIRYLEGAVAWPGGSHDVAYTADTEHDRAINAAYFTKYGRGLSTLAITRRRARQTTLRIDPR